MDFPALTPAATTWGRILILHGSRICYGLCWGRDFGHVPQWGHPHPDPAMGWGLGGEGNTVCVHLTGAPTPLVRPIQPRGPHQGVIGYDGTWIDSLDAPKFRTGLLTGLWVSFCANCSNRTFSLRVGMGSRAVGSEAHAGFTQRIYKL